MALVFSGITVSGGLQIDSKFVPNAPTIGTATATGATTATVAFTAPSYGGSTTITSYTATSSPGNITGTISQAGSGTITVSGLSSSTSYTFTVTATNSNGTSVPSAASNSITTQSSGTPPVNTVAPVVSGTQNFGSTLSSTTGTWTGTATITYTYQWQRSDGTFSNIPSATSSTYTLVQADVNRLIRCVVTATNGVGNASANSNSTSDINPIAPGAPTSVSATVTSDTSVNVAYTAPTSNGGATITTYTATSSPGNITGTVSQAGSGTISVTGLTTGTSYTFTVTATNIAGTGNASSPSSSVTPTINVGFIGLLESNFTPTYNGSIADSSGFYVSEFLGSPSASGGRVTLISKYNSYGSATWQKSIPVCASVNNSVTLDNSGNLYTVADYYTGFLSDQAVAVLIKYDSSGTIVWQIDLPFTNDGVPGASIATAVDSSNNVYLLAQDYSSSIVQGILVKFDGSDGTLLWQRVISESTYGFAPLSFAVRGTSIYIVGGTYDPAISNNVSNVVKYNLDGDLQWQKIITDDSGSNFNIATNVITIDSLDNIYLAGLYNYNLFLAKYDGNAVPQWAQYGVTGGIIAVNDIVTDSSDNIYVIGTTDPSSGLNYAFITKFLNSYSTLYPDTYVYENKLTSNVGNTSGISISVNDSSMFISGTNDASTDFTLIGRLPSDGSLTGTYTVGSYSYAYEADYRSWIAANTIMGNGNLANSASNFSSSITSYTTTDESVNTTTNVIFTTSPINTVPPVVSGSTTPGSTLSVTNGTWAGNSPITYTYQWVHAPLGNISGATSSTYTVLSADIDQRILCLVTGTNGSGNSSASSNVTATIQAGVPGAPTIGTATATGETTATVSFTAPASNGGATITTYTATSSPGNITGTLSQAGSGTITVTGLTGSTSYTFTVTATNSVGTSSASAASNSITTDSPLVRPLRAIFGYGRSTTALRMTNLVSNTGVVGNDVTGVGTARLGLAAAGYGTDKAIFGYGDSSTSGGSYTAVTNKVSNTGVVALDTAGVGTPRSLLAAATYGTDKALFGYGFNNSGSAVTNLVSNTGVVATNTAGVGTARMYLAAAGYGADKAIFGYGYIYATSTFTNITNLVSNTGVVGNDVTGVGTIRNELAAAGYGGDKAIFGYGARGANYYSLTNLVSNTGVVALDTTGVGTARFGLAAAIYGADKAIFGYGIASGSTRLSMTNLVTNTGVVGNDVTGVGTARNSLAAAGYSLT